MKYICYLENNLQYQMCSTNKNYILVNELTRILTYTWPEFDSNWVITEGGSTSSIPK